MSRPSSPGKSCGAGVSDAVSGTCPFSRMTSSVSWARRWPPWRPPRNRRPAEAVDLIDVEYGELESVLDPLEAMEPPAALIHPEVMSYEGLPDPLTAPTNTFVHVCWAKGDVAQGFRQSELIVERTYLTQLVHQGYIEPHTCVVKALPDAGAEIWACSKTPLALRRQVSAALDAPFDRLLVHPCAIGGDFGGKGDFMDVALCYVLSQRSGWAGEDDHGPGRGVRRRQPASRRRHPREDGSDPGRSPHEPAHGLRVRQRSLRRIQAHGSCCSERRRRWGPTASHTLCRKSGWSTPTRFPAAICGRRAIPRACSRARARWTWWRGSWAWTRWSSGGST